MVTVINFSVDNTSKVKLYHQLYTKIAESIDSGEIKSGSKLPSVRVLSEQLNISRNTVTKAYKELGNDGYLYSLVKSGFYAKKPSEPIPASVQNVSVPISDPENTDSIPTVDSIFKQHQTQSIPSEAESFSPEEFGESIIDAMVHEPEDLKEQSFSTGTTENSPSLVVYPENELEEDSNTIQSVPKTEPVLSSQKQQPVMPTGTAFEDSLLDSYRVALIEKQHLLHKSSGTFGDDSFRIAIAAFMYNFHHIDVNPKQIIIGSCIEQLLYNVLRLNSINKPYTKSFGQGLLSLATQVAEGNNVIIPTVAMAEDPDHTMRHVFMDANIQVKEIPVDDMGLSIDFLVTSGCNLAYVTPFDIPQGVEFNDCSQRREEILGWAVTAPYRYVIEFDTHTSKIQNETFKQIDKADKVIYLNSFKHLLDRAINASWMVLPKNLAEEYTSRYTTFDCTLSYLDQIALTDFITKGKLDAYLSNLEQI